jgi:predicted Rossmann-fold nucleotide-binding protein
VKRKIGIFGSIAGIDSKADEAASKLARALEKYADQIVVITGACPGLPYIVASHLAKKGAEVWGFSPRGDLVAQKKYSPNDDPEIYTKLIYSPPEIVDHYSLRVAFKYRNVLSTANCDAGIVISGRWGSLNEFTNLMDMQKLACVLTGTGGVADELPALTRRVKKEGQGIVIFDDDPERLVDQIMSDETWRKLEASRHVNGQVV